MSIVGPIVCVPLRCAYYGVDSAVIEYAHPTDVDGRCMWSPAILSKRRQNCLYILSQRATESPR